MESPWWNLLAIPLLTVFCFMGYSLWDADGLKRKRRTLRRARRVSIAEAPEDEVIRIDGRVLEGETVEAPLSGRRCVYYSVTVTDLDGEHTRQRAHETGGVAFTIDDGTGRAIVDIVDSKGARIIEWGGTRSGTIDKPTAREAAFLERHGIKHVYWEFETFYYTEYVFEIGESIAVMCQPVRELAPDAASRSAVYRDLPPMADLYVSGSSAHPILLSKLDL